MVLSWPGLTVPILRPVVISPAIATPSRVNLLAEEILAGKTSLITTLLIGTLTFEWITTLNSIMSEGLAYKDCDQFRLPAERLRADSVAIRVLVDCEVTQLLPEQIWLTAQV